MNRDDATTARFPQASAKSNEHARIGAFAQFPPHIGEAIMACWNTSSGSALIDQLQEKLPDLTRDELRTAVLRFGEEFYRLEADRIRPAVEAYRAEVAFKRGCPVELPIGGATGLDHQSTAAIDEAAAWLAAETTLPIEIVPALRMRFGLSFEEASFAIGDAQRRRADVRQ